MDENIGFFSGQYSASYLPFAEIISNYIVNNYNKNINIRYRS